jgi:hypothetical protein
MYANNQVRPANQFDPVRPVLIQNKSVGARLGVSRNYRFGYSRPELRPAVPAGE